MLLVAAGAIQFIHWPGKPVMNGTSQGATIQTTSRPDRPGWKSVQQFALALAAGVIGTLVYSETYGRLTQEAAVTGVVDRVGKDAIEATTRSLSAHLQLLPSEVFRTRDDT